MNIKIIKKYLAEIIVVSFSLLFSFWLMFSTFSYKDGSMLIASKAWSDFASHIPLIRSFSFGNNFPPEYPLFPGEPIRYHFLFYAVVGMLEKIGLRIDFALNIPSALSFAALIIIIYFFAKMLFKSKFVGILSLVLFLFNGSFSFLYFLNQHQFSFPQIIFDIVRNETFPAFAPYDQTLISGGFWNLNVFTNQRHLALPLALTLFMTYFLIKSESFKKTLSLKVSILFGVFFGVFSFLHGAIFVMVIAIFVSLFFLFSRQKKSIFLIAVVAFFVSLPRILFLWQVESGDVFKFTPGYLVANNLSLSTWVRYWILNLGVGFLFIPLGLLLAPNLAKKIFIVFSSLFIIANLFQFSPDIATNHKFFNLWLIVMNMFISYALFFFWQKRWRQKILTCILLFLLMFSGIIDFFAIKNDRIYPVIDYLRNPDIKWIMENTPKNTTFLNSSYLYNPASLAGRKIFLGWPYFSWSLGYDTNARDNLRKNLFNPPSIKLFCKETRKYYLEYVSVEPSVDTDLKINRIFFDLNFSKAYENSKNGITIYSTKSTCLKYAQ